MNKLLLITLSCLTFTCLTGCNKEEKEPSVDYSLNTNWCKLGNTGTDAVDTFYIYPTITYNEDVNYASIDDCREKANALYTVQASVYEESTNVYVPLYRQATFPYEVQCGTSNQAILDLLYKGRAYNDLCDALDYYFAHYNNNKPFILAGHSQGSCLLVLLLEHYFGEHQNYLNNMIAAYAIGFAPSVDLFTRCSYLKFATGETDTGSIISFNTEGANASGESLLFPTGKAKVINPLNWKTDDTYASVQENLGSLSHKTFTVGDGIADAQINLSRGTLVCTTVDTWTEAPGVFQNESLHEFDYALYYNNIKQNVAKRIDAFSNK